MPKSILDRINEGDFNHMSQKGQIDGSVVVTISKFGERQAVRARIKLFNTPAATILGVEEVIALPQDDASGRLADLADSYAYSEWVRDLHKPTEA